MKRRSDKRAAMDPWKHRQRVEVIDRSAGQCEFEMAVIGLVEGETHHNGQRVKRELGAVWVRCSETRGLQIAHVFRRAKNGAMPDERGCPLLFTTDAAIAGCSAHHAAFDSRLERVWVRAPQEAVDRARAVIERVLALPHNVARATPVGLTNL